MKDCEVEYQNVAEKLNAWELVGLPLDPLGPFTNAHFISRTYPVQFGLVFFVYFYFNLLYFKITWERLLSALTIFPGGSVPTSGVRETISPLI